MQPQQQQQVRVPEFICELSQPQILSQPCSAPFWSLGGTPPHTAPAFFNDTTSRSGYTEQTQTPPREAEGASPPRRRGIGLRVEFPRPQGTATTKLSKLILAAWLPRLTEYGGVMSLYMRGVHFQLPPLVARLRLCGPPGRSAPVNLIYPLFRLRLPPASHIFST